MNNTEFRQKLESMYGGCINFGRAAAILGSERKVLAAIITRELIAAEIDGKYMIPVFQFTETGLRPEIKALNHWLLDRRPEYAMEFFWSPAFSDSEETPVDILLRGITETELHALKRKAKFGSFVVHPKQ